MRVSRGAAAVRVRRIGIGLVGVGLGLAGCGGGAGGGGGSAGPQTPAPAPPPGPAPIAVAVSFGAASAEVYEGDTVEIPVRYETRNLASPWRLSISPVPGTADAADFSLPEGFVEIPAGSGTTGEVVFRLVGLLDSNFDEGSETLALRFVPDPAVNAEIGGDLPMMIHDGGVLVSFGTESAEVYEAEALEIPVRYEVRNLGSPARIAIAPVPGTAEAADFSLPESFVEIPAGRGTTGEVVFRLVALPDSNFDEGSETLALRFASAPGVQGADDLPVVIRDGGVLVSFGTESAEVYEGDAVEIPVRYEVRNLGSPWRLSIAPVPGTAQAADFSLPESFVEIPAGRGTTGEVGFRLIGLPDSNFDEGPERLALRFAPDSSVGAQIGDEIPVVIREGGALVSFAEESVGVEEGTTLEVPIRYEVRNLTAPVRLSVSPLLVTLEEDDLLVSGAALEIPAGRGLTGAFGLRLTALADDLFAEADEGGSIRFVPPDPALVSLHLGADLDFVVRDAGVAPCPGVRLRARPPAPSEDAPNRIGARNRHLFSAVTVDLDASAQGVSVVLRAPYHLWDEVEGFVQPLAAVRVAEWRRETVGAAVRHEFDLEWPDAAWFAEPDFEFGFVGGSCSGDSTAVCRAGECELTP